MLADEYGSAPSIHHQRLSSWMSSVDKRSPISTNQPSIGLPFQRWFKFKEAFSPQLVLDVLRSSGATRVERCLDAFGGCGTTGLTCQFAGVHPVLIEVNPFIADLAEAKLATYDPEVLSQDFLAVRAQARRRLKVDLDTLADAPRTLCEPGDGKRWVFPKEVLVRLLQYRTSIESVDNDANRRLLRVLLGSVVVGVSNVTINGKGRKYRGAWMDQQRTERDVDSSFQVAFLTAISDVQRYGKRQTSSYELLRGSCLAKIAEVDPCDLAVFSPPYPNSFDYTDIYNLELWVLGYLRTRADNRALRMSTLRSHIQAGGQHTFAPANSQMLGSLMGELSHQRDSLWDERIVGMVGAYFDDMQILLTQLRSKLRPGGRAVIVIGESSYVGIKVRAGHISAQIARAAGFKVARHVRLRTMRVSAQQGGERELDERLLELIND